MGQRTRRPSAPAPRLVIFSEPAPALPEGILLGPAGSRRARRNAATSAQQALKASGSWALRCRRALEERPAGDCIHDSCVFSVA